MDQGIVSNLPKDVAVSIPGTGTITIAVTVVGVSGANDI
jgi:hypothetical protein